MKRGGKMNERERGKKEKRGREKERKKKKREKEKEKLKEKGKKTAIKKGKNEKIIPHLMDNTSMKSLNTPVLSRHYSFGSCICCSSC